MSNVTVFSILNVHICLRWWLIIRAVENWLLCLLVHSVTYDGGVLVVMPRAELHPQLLFYFFILRQSLWAQTSDPPV